jgi:hypothetical protein
LRLISGACCFPLGWVLLGVLPARIVFFWAILKHGKGVKHLWVLDLIAE